MNRRFILNNIWALFLPGSMAKNMIKLKNQFSRISLFQTQNFRGAPRGAPKNFTDPKNILTCSEWSNLNLEKKIGSIVIRMWRQLTAEGSRRGLRPPPPPWLGLKKTEKKRVVNEIRRLIISCMINDLVYATNLNINKYNLKSSQLYMKTWIRIQKGVHPHCVRF